jgi:hypothetical protein
MLEALLEQINHHLEQNSIIVSLGSINIIDVSVIEAKQSRKRKGGKRVYVQQFVMRPLNLKNFF